MQTRPRSWWPYLLVTFAALLLTFAWIVVVIASAKARQTTVIDPQTTRADLRAFTHARDLAYGCLIGGQGLALVAFVALAAHGHRVAIARFGMATFLVATVLALSTGCSITWVLVGNLVAMIGLGCIRALGDAPRALIFIGGILGPFAAALDNGFAPIAAAVAAFAFAIRAWRLRVAAY